ncbi:hypothetical protein EVAR_13694_1 [Eumeta japonica]|uniref:Uncharacterized protein n=1 Tax=Eumeta variegata TaxID=151549 RepID=A0A4C1UBL3_EUMVA|nr:hypothetical protein EVAR_13694_1 [Eumeta japonica]
MSRAVGTHTCRPAALGEAIEVVRSVARLVARLYSIADHRLHLQGEFFSGFQSHTTHAYGREGVQDRHFNPLHVASGKQKKKKITASL